jgi:hypothetical protein
MNHFASFDKSARDPFGKVLPQGGLSGQVSTALLNPGLS